MPKESIKTGFSSLDQITGGFAPGTLILLGSETGAGKTALATQIALAVAQQSDSGGVLFFSYECSVSELTTRFLRQLSGGQVGSLRRSVELGENLRKLPITINEKSFSVEDLPGQVEAYIQSEGHAPSLVIIDTLNLVGSEMETNEIKRLARVVRDIKLLAQQFELPVLATYQHSRRPSIGPSSEPVNPNEAAQPLLSAVEQDANLVLELLAPYLRLKDLDYKNQLLADGAEVTLAVVKSRSGPIGKVILYFQSSSLLYREK